MYLAKAALCIIILIVDGVGVAELVVVKAIDAPIFIPRVYPRGRRVQVLVGPVVVICPFWDRRRSWGGGSWRRGDRPVQGLFLVSSP